MRPFWERVTTWNIANHLADEMPAATAYRFAALVVRGLDRKYNLQAEMYGRPFAEPGDLDDPEITSPKYQRVMNSFWRAVGAGIGGRYERNRIEALGVASMLSGGPSETKTAAILAAETPTIEEFLGKPGLGLEEEWESGWSGLRDDIAEAFISPQREELLSYYDALVTDAAFRRSMTRRFQEFAQDRGLYTRSLDGIWGIGTEGAFVELVPQARERLTSMSDVQRFVAVASGAFSDGEVVALGITRDEWLRSRGITTEEGDAERTPIDVSTIEVSVPDKPEEEAAAPMETGPQRVPVDTSILNQGRDATTETSSDTAPSTGAAVRYAAIGIGLVVAAGIVIAVVRARKGSE